MIILNKNNLKEKNNL